MINAVLWQLVSFCSMLPQYCIKVPDDGHRPKHVGVTVQYFNVNFNILYV